MLMSHKNRNIMLAATKAHHAHRNFSKAVKYFCQQVFSFGNMITNYRNDSLRFIYLNAAKHFQLPDYIIEVSIIVNGERNGHFRGGNHVDGRLVFFKYFKYFS